MDFTVCSARSIGFELTVFADQAVFLRAFFDALLLLAINHAAKVRLFTLKALIECARVKCKALQIALERISTCSQPFAVIETLVFCHLQGHLFNGLAQLKKLIYLSLHLRAARLRYQLVTAGTRHEPKGYLQRVPPVLEQS